MKYWVILIAAAVAGALWSADITAYHKATFGQVTFNKHGIAHIVTKDGWIAINKKKQILYKPFIYDNGPDDAAEGLSRFVENGKMGFVNEAGKKVIPAQYDFVAPFEAGKAVFCIGCKQVKDGEHTTMDRKTGDWGEIDKKGRRLAGAKP